jgi:hypothetical protein
MIVSVITIISRFQLRDAFRCVPCPTLVRVLQRAHIGLTVLGNLRKFFSADEIYQNADKPK